MTSETSIRLQPQCIHCNLVFKAFPTISMLRYCLNVFLIKAASTSQNLNLATQQKYIGFQ